MTAGAAPPDEEAADGSRGDRTRSAILAASRKLFLERGYAGTPVNAITEACGISNGGFYTYFKDKRDVFNTLGETAYREALTVLDRWSDSPLDYGITRVREWVAEYFTYMDTHGAFVIAAAHSAPDDDGFRRDRAKMASRAAWKLGRALIGDAAAPPEAIGVAAVALLDRSWYAVYIQNVPVGRDEAIAVVAETLLAMSNRREPSCPGISDAG